MYVSKYYTGEQIDQRLLQNYYDDFVEAGYVGTKKEFFEFVLSISNKVDKKDGYGLSKNDFDDVLKNKLDSIKVITHVSDLVNDLRYQTDIDVSNTIDKRISALLDGADGALDTLKELADALGNDPNFASTIAGKLGELRRLLDEEVSRSVSNDSELSNNLTALSEKLDTTKSDILKLINDKESQYEQNHADLNEKITQNKEEIIKFKAELDNTLLQAKSYTDEGLKTESERAIAKEGELANDINDVKNTHTLDKAELKADITAEASIRQSNDEALSARINAANSAHVQDIQNLQNSLNLEVSAREKADETLSTTITTEVAKLASEDVKLDTKISGVESSLNAKVIVTEGKIDEEITNRKNEDILIRHSIEDLSNKVDSNNTQSKEYVDGLVSDINRQLSELESDKVDKKEGYGLSKNDLDDVLLNKLNNIQDFANHITRLSELENDTNFTDEDKVRSILSEVVGAAPDALDSLKELADALGNDPNFASTIMSRITSLAEQINEETESRETGDDILSDEIEKLGTNLTNNYKAADDIVKTFLTQHIDNSIKQLTLLLDALDDKTDTEITHRSEDIARVEGLISAEATNRQNADNTHIAAINKLVTNLNDVKTELTTKDNEILSKVQDNTTNIGANAAEIALLKTRIDSNKSSAESLIQSVDTKLTEEIENRKLGDENLRGVTDTINTRVLTEELRAQAAEENLQSNIDKVDSDYKAADALNLEKVNTSISEKVSELTKEDANIKNLLSLEQKDRQNEDALIHGEISKLTTSVNADITVLRDNITDTTNKLTSEISRATNKENEISAKLDTLEETHQTHIAAINSALGDKVDKKEGYGLSKNNFTDELKIKLDSISEGATRILKLSDILVQDMDYQTSEDVRREIESVIGSAPEALNSLKELADALGNDPNFAATINQKLADLNTQYTLFLKDVELFKEQLETEKVKNLSQDKLIAQNVSAIQSNLELIQTLQVEDNTFRTQIIDQVNLIVSSVEANKQLILSKLEEEASIRELEDSKLNTKIEKETSDREKADTTITNNLNSEIAARKAVTGINAQTYQPNLDSNYISSSSNLNDADKKLDAELKSTNTKLEDETTRATNAEQELSNRVTSLETLTASQTQEINSLKSRVGTLETELAAAKERISSIENTISLIQASQS